MKIIYDVLHMAGSPMWMPYRRRPCLMVGDGIVREDSYKVLRLPSSELVVATQKGK